jgi:hypothetical protein
MSQNSAITGLATKNYRAGDSTVMVNNKLIYSYGEDNMFTVSYDNDLVTVKEDPQGNGVASISSNHGGTITLNVTETSPSNAILTDLVQTGNFPVDIVTSTVHISAQHCYIQKIPDTTGGKEASNRAWQIKAIYMDETSLVGEE